MDAWVFPLWIGCNLLLGVSAWKLARRCFPSDLPMPLLMHTLVLAWAGIAAVTFALGAAGILTAWALMFGVVFVALAVLLGLRLLHQPASLAPPEMNRPESFWLWFWFAVLTLWMAHSITSGLLRFPTDWDTLNYHLPLIVQWLHAESLYAPACAQWSNPGNNEIVGLWLVAPFSGDFMIGLNNLPAAILLACAAVEVGRNLGLSSALAHLTGFAVVSNFVVLNQMLDASNDVAVAALFLACLAYGFRFAKNTEARFFPDLFLFAPALGLLAGVKFYALGYAAVAGSTFFLLCWKRQGWRRGMGLATMGLVGLFLWAGYWYLRNAWVTGSPLYPKTFTSEIDQMANIYPDLAQTTFLGNRRPELYELSVKAIWHMSGPLHVAAFVLLPLTLPWIFISAWMHKKKNPTEAADFRWTFAFLVAGSCSVLLITPFAVEDQPGTLNQMYWYYCPVRYGMCFLSLAVLALAVTLQDIFSGNSILAWLPCLFFLGNAIHQLAFPSSRLPLEKTEVLIIAGNVFLVAINGFLLANLWPRFAKAVLLVVFLAVLAGGAWGIDHLADRWHQGFPGFYDRTFATGTFSFLAKEDPEGRICMLDHRCYPFFGSRRQFRICQPVYVPSCSWLMKYLQNQEARFVAARPNRDGGGWHLFDEFDACLRDNPAVFQRLTGDNGLALFRIVGSSRSAK